MRKKFVKHALVWGILTGTLMTVSVLTPMTAQAAEENAQIADEVFVDETVAEMPSGESLYDSDVITTGKCGDNLTWSYNDATQILTITGSGEMKNYDTGSNQRPSVWNWVKKIEFGPGVTSIGKYAFWRCGHIESVTIPGNIKTIGRSAFEYCSSLANVTLCEGIKTIDSGAFGWCDKITSVTLPGSIETCYGFNRNENLQSLTATDGVRMICVSYEPKLRTLQVPDSVTDLEIEGCPDLGAVAIPPRLQKLRLQECDNFRSLSGLPSTLESLTVTECQNLTSIVVPGSVCELDLTNCATLASITIPKEAFGYNEVSFIVQSTAAGKAGVTLPVATTIYTDDKSIREFNFSKVGRSVTFRSLDGSADPAPTANTTAFTDVPKGSWYEEPVNWAVGKGITNGLGDGRFGTSDTCTRAQILTFLWRAEKTPEVTYQNQFSDVTADKFYAKPVAWAVSKGITNGTSPTTFGPNDPCTRAQIVTFLYKLYH